MVNSKWSYSPETPNLGKNQLFFLAVWPWNLMDDHEEQQGISSKQHQALCIISSPYVNSNWSYSQKKLNGVMTSVTLTFDLDLLHGHHVCQSPENFRMIRWQGHCHKGVTYGQMDKRTDGRTDGRTDRQTDISVLRAAWSLTDRQTDRQTDRHKCS